LESIFSQDQTDKLIAWKNFLQTEKVQKWRVREDQTEEEIRNILEEANFSKGSNLTAENLDQIFHLMRNFSANRALSKLLYVDNGLDLFNQRLRELYYGRAPFPKRVDAFLRLKGIGKQTLSQLLLALDPMEYPLITSQTKDALELDAQQQQKAMEIATRKFQIENPQQYLDLTLDFLRDFVIFEQIKNLLNIEKYTSINNLIWVATREDVEGPEDVPESYTSVSLEKDLKEYLAKNPHVLEKGLKLIQKEFPTKEVGNIDLLLKDNKGYEVVAELKKGRKSDDVVGQISRYMGWVLKNRNKKVRGIIVVGEPDQRLEYSILPFGGSIKIRYYRVKFQISNEYKED
jgi:hypothetical protein